MINSHDFYKLNLFKKGYSYVWSDDKADNRFTLRQLEQAIPEMDHRPICPHIGYNITRLSADTLLFVVGCYWPQLQDEYGRNGLSFWHGSLYERVTFDEPNALLTLSDKFISLLERYRFVYPQLGSVVGKLAIETAPVNWLSDLRRISADTPITINDSLRATLRTQSAEQLPPFTNVLMPFPYEKVLALPYMLLQMGRDRELIQVGGGAIAPSSLHSLVSLSAPSKRFTQVTPSFGQQLSTTHKGRVQPNNSPPQKPKPVANWQVYALLGLLMFTLLFAIVQSRRAVNLGNDLSQTNAVIDAIRNQGLIDPAKLREIEEHVSQQQ